MSVLNGRTQLTWYLLFDFSYFWAFWGFCFGCDCFGVLSFISNIVMFYNSDDICTFLAFQRISMIVALLFTFYLDIWKRLVNCILWFDKGGPGRSKIHFHVLERGNAHAQPRSFHQSLSDQTYDSKWRGNPQAFSSRYSNPQHQPQS